MVVPEVGVLVKTDRVLTTSKGVKTKVPVIIGCNVFSRAVKQLCSLNGKKKSLKSHIFSRFCGI